MDTATDDVNVTFVAVDAVEFSDAIADVASVVTIAAAGLGAPLTHHSLSFVMCLTSLCSTGMCGGPAGFCENHKGQRLLAQIEVIPQHHSYNYATTEQLLKDPYHGHSDKY